MNRPIKQLYENSTCKKCNKTPEATAYLPPSFTLKLPKETQILIKEVYEGKKPLNILNITAKMLAESIKDSYTNITTDFTTADTEMLTRLVQDVWHFSSAKNYQQLRDLTLQLIDEKGALRSFEQFSESAQTVTDLFNKTWLRTEYNFAVASSQSAARWQEYESEKSHIPNLQFQTVGDEQVRDSHARLDGIILAIGDPRLDELSTPLDWGCRCEWVQVLGGSEILSKDIPKVEVPPMFRTNLAKEGLIYPKGHPYYEGTPDAELRKAIAYLPPKNTYFDVVLGNNEIAVHPLHGKQELHTNINVCNALLIADKNAKIQLLPVLNQGDKKARGNFLPKAYLSKFPRKNPDALYNKKVVEFETANGSRSSIQNAIRNGKRQSDFVIIHIPDGDLNQAKRVAVGALNHFEKKPAVWLVNDLGELIVIKQKGT